MRSGYKYLHRVFKVVFVYTCTHTHKQKHKFANVYESHLGYIDEQKSVNETDYIFEIKLCGEKKNCVCVFLCVLRHLPPHD